VVHILCRLYATLYISSFSSNATTPTQIYTLSLHDALPISIYGSETQPVAAKRCSACVLMKSFRALSARAQSIGQSQGSRRNTKRSEEHTSELQSPCNLVCRLLLEKKKKNRDVHSHTTVHKQ